MENLAFLSKEVPGFAVKGANVNVMTEPSQFYNELCALAASAKQRTVLATLYVGTGFKEQTLLDNVKKSLQETDGEVKVKILLDYCRGTRDVKGKSSCTMLLPLVEQYKVRHYRHLEVLYIVKILDNRLRAPPLYPHLFCIS